MSRDCTCCEGVGRHAPDPLDNPPGQGALSYRVGTHTDFFNTMVARLSTLQAEQDLGGSAASSRGGEGCLGESHRSFLLGGDPEAATALLDGWACLADVLAFYQERIANEGYLRTATEERSVIELGRLTGYEPRPGVAASVHLAFTVQEGFDGEIPERTRTQSSPRPGQAAQMFETSHAINARAEWNALVASGRATGRYIRREYIVRPHDPKHGFGGVRATGRIEIFLAGTGQNVQAGDVVLVADPARKVNEKPKPEEVYRVSEAWPHPETAHTTLRLVPLDRAWIRGGEWDEVVVDSPDVPDPPAPEPAPPAPGAPEPFLATASSARARRTLDMLAGGVGFADASASGKLLPTAEAIALIAPGRPDLREYLAALARTLQPEPAPRVYVMRVRAQVFGHAVPPIQEISSVIEKKKTTSVSEPREHAPAADEKGNRLFLAGELAAIRVGTPLVLRAPPADEPDAEELTTRVFMVDGIQVQSRLAYGAPGKATLAELDEDWWQPQRPSEGSKSGDIKPIRRSLAYAQPELLALVGEPLKLPVGGGSIDLDRAVGDMPAGRLVIVEGERDLPGVTGVRIAEVAKVASCSVLFTREPALLHTKGPLGAGAPEAAVRSSGYTRITFATPLRNVYRRSTVIVRGNVVHATHGETRDEVLGSGDASASEQRFTLRQGPRTWESAATPSGITSSLAVRVSGVLWPEVPSYSLLGARDEVVRSRTLSDRKDEIRGGDGRRGARFPTGIENLTARYRVGIGASGNVDVGLINALVTRPIGVQEVVNSVRSSGGADADDRDAIRTRIPIAARSIDRLVSVTDHADFALNFAGVAKATARERQGTVEIVIAGGEDVLIDEGSDLLKNLRAALQAYGDPLLRPVLRVAKAVPMLLHASVRIDPRYDWPQVEGALRERVLSRQGWDARAIGEPAYLSVVLEAMQSVAGVRSIDVDAFGPLRPTSLSAAPRPSIAPEQEAAVRELLLERQLGLSELLDARDAGRRTWAFAADAGEVLYFARVTPALVLLTEVAS